MNYELPNSVLVGGVPVAVRSDFRVILDIMEALNDPDLDDADRSAAVIQMFYPNWRKLRNYQEALEKMFWFIDGGQAREKKKSPRLVDWEQDFDRIIAPVNRVLGMEARAVPYDPKKNTGGLHWWTFLAAYMEIGNDCLFSQIVSIRDKMKRGKKLDKNEREWYRRNRDLVEIKTHYSDAELALEKEWT